MHFYAHLKCINKSQLYDMVFLVEFKPLDNTIKKKSIVPSH